MAVSFMDLCVRFELQLEWAYAYVSHNLRPEEGDAWGK